MEIDKIVIKTGNFYEVYAYANPIQIDNKYRLTKPKRKQTKQRKDNKEITDIYVKKAASRAKNKIRRLIVGNMWQATERLRFVTLTFHKAIEDLNTANYEFKKFRQVLNRKIHTDLSYVAVPEIQEKRKKKYGHSVWHYHYISFNQPYIKTHDLEKIWGHGRCWINEVYKTDGTGNYLSKYLSKSYADPRMKNKKRYYNAVQHQPQSVYHPQATALLHQHLLESANPVQDYPLFKNNNKELPVGHKYEFISL